MLKGMKFFVIFVGFCFLSCMAWGQPSQEEVARVRAQIAKIRQTTNWDDPAAAKKANEEIQKLSGQLTGNKNQSFQFPPQQSTPPKKQESVAFSVKVASTKECVLSIADRFYKRSYKALDAVSKVKFDQDFDAAQKEKFSMEALRNLTSSGAALITFGKDHHLACVYLTSAVKAAPSDTLSINNFGGYLRIIDSVAISIPVLLYANTLFSGSPVILTQLGNSYFELGDLKNAESWYKSAIKCNPDFGQAHSALTTLYIKQGRFKEAIQPSIDLNDGEVYVIYNPDRLFSFFTAE
jgi:tetratricopeptide (TPR) repeat protein